MIIFYNKQTGDIVGTIEGRIHSLEQLKMWIGEKDAGDRIIVQWTPVRFLDSFGQETTREKAVRTIWEPDTAQKELFTELDRNPSLIHEYRVDPDSELLVKKQ